MASSQSGPGSLNGLSLKDLEPRYRRRYQPANQALRQINSIHPDVVITDIHMPGSGFSLIEELKKKDEGPIVIVLTNYPYPQYQERSIQAGADYFFDKSSEFTNVIDVIHEIKAA